jgi:hypothetical protein
MEAENSTTAPGSIPNMNRTEAGDLLPTKEVVISDTISTPRPIQSSSTKIIEAIQSTVSTFNSKPVTSKLFTSITSIIPPESSQSNQTTNEMSGVLLNNITSNNTYNTSNNNINITTNQMTISQTSTVLQSNSLNSSSCLNSTSNQTPVQISTSTTKLIYLAATTKNPFLHFWYEPLLRAKPNHSRSSGFLLKNMEFINKHPFLLFVFGMTTLLFICLISIGVILLSNEHMPRQTSNLKKINCLTA